MLGSEPLSAVDSGTRRERSENFSLLIKQQREGGDRKSAGSRGLSRGPGLQLRLQGVPITKLNSTAVLSPPGGSQSPFAGEEA